MEENKTVIIKQIEQAFKNVTKEDGTSLHETRVIDDRGSKEEIKQARKLDKDIHWSEIPDN